jgi:hypothetical protein
MSEVGTGFSLLNLEVKKEKKNARKRVKACFFFTGCGTNVFRMANNSLRILLMPLYGIPSRDFLQAGGQYLCSSHVMLYKNIFRKGKEKRG